MYPVLFLLCAALWYFATRQVKAAKKPVPQTEAAQSGYLSFRGAPFAFGDAPFSLPFHTLIIVFGMIMFLFIPNNHRPSSVWYHHITGAGFVLFGLLRWCGVAWTRVDVSDNEVVIMTAPMAYIRAQRSKPRIVRFENLKNTKVQLGVLLLDDGAPTKARIGPVFSNSNVLFSVINYRWEHWKSQNQKATNL